MSDQLTNSTEFAEQATNVQSYVSNATPSVNSDQFGALKITAQAAAITGVTVTGTPNDLQQLVVRILDNGSARAITWGSQFEAVGAALITTTVAGKRHTLRFLYSTDSSKWGLVNAAVEA